MFGFVIGSLCLVGLFKVARGGRGWHHSHHRGSARRRWMTRWLFERLETSPGQEKVILDAIDGVRDAAFKARSELRNTGPDLAKAMRAEQLDHEILKQAFLRQDGQLEEIRRALLVGLEKVHEALSPRQREELAQLIERAPMLGGPGFAGRCGHHRRGWGRHSFDDARMA